jgi:hypothetical protein
MGKSSDCVLGSSRFVVVALHESDHGATTLRPAFAIGDALAVSFDHLVGAHHDRRRDSDAECLGGFEIYD